MEMEEQSAKGSVVVTIGNDDDEVVTVDRKVTIDEEDDTFGVEIRSCCFYYEDSIAMNLFFIYLIFYFLN